MKPTVDELLGITPTVAQVERDMQAMPHPIGDLRHQANGISRQFRDVRKVSTAAAAIGRIPGPAEAFHILISGRFALWHTVPAIISLAACPITTLHIATLGFSRDNIDSLAELLDAGQIGTASLLCSHYFKGTSKEIYSHAITTLAKRPQARFLSLRTHAKLIAMLLSDGRTITVEASANLRSCKNIEQMMLTGDPGLYRFHTQWINDLFSAAALQEAQP